MPTIAETLSQAMQQHQAGNLQQAEQLYRQILQVFPYHADALHLLGLMAYQLGRNEVAVEYINKAISANPIFSPFHCNLGAGLSRQGRLAEAEASYREALRSRRNIRKAHYNLGNLFRDQGKFAEAAASYQTALHVQARLCGGPYQSGQRAHSTRQVR